MKKCSVCGRELPISEFYIKKGKPNYMCKDCERAYRRNRYIHKKVKKEHVGENKKCIQCKYRTGFGEGGRETICYYLGYTGKRRGCSIENCDKFVKGTPISVELKRRFVDSCYAGE